MKLDYTDAELVELADWAEKQDREEKNAEFKKAYGALRQGADWLLRSRVKRRQVEIENIGSVMSKATVKQ